MTGGSTPAMDIGGGGGGDDGEGGRRTERLDSDRTNEDMSFISSAPKELPHSFVDLGSNESSDAARAVLHEANYRFGGTMPILTEETDVRMVLENEVLMLPGEVRQRILDRPIVACEDGYVGITNYRFLQIIFASDKGPRKLMTFPLAEVETCDLVRTFDAKIVMKGGRVHTITFCTAVDASVYVEIIKKISAAMNRLNSRIYQKNDATPGSSNEVNEVFAWEFSKAVDQECPSWLKRADYVANEITHIDFKRLGMEESFRISSVNENFEVCPTYPEKIIVPKTITDDEIRFGAPYRSIGRFPAVVWRCTKTKAVLLRCSQPQVGILAWRNVVDEKIVEEAVKAGRVEGEEKKQFVIQDARAYASAWANRARSGGYENSENYQQAKMDFLGLPNIHTVRGSFESIRSLLHQQSSQDQVLNNLQGTNWLTNISSILFHASNCADYLNKGHSVLVHCSDGWDRTTQITTLAKLMLDEHYRTIDGFSELIRRDWIGFGHKLSDRNVCATEGSERSPIFSQFLEAVRHLQRTQPTAFQFSHAYLIKLAQHVYSGLFGTFMFNSHKERKEAMEMRKGKTLVEIWRFLNADNEEFVNQTYDPNYTGALKGEWNFGVMHLSLWHELFADRGVQCADFVPQQRSSSGTATPVTAPMKKTLVKSKSTESVNSTCDMTSELLHSMNSSFHQPIVLNPTTDGSSLLDHDGLLKLQDAEQSMLRQKNRRQRPQEQLLKRDREINELRRQRELSNNDRTNVAGQHSISDSDNEPGLERALSDMSMVDPESEMPNFRANTTWEARSACCYLCGKSFIEMSVYQEDRQHHCRNCGKVVCDLCSKHRYAVVEEGKSVQKRACDTCYDSMHENSENGEKMISEQDPLISTPHGTANPGPFTSTLLTKNNAKEDSFPRKEASGPIRIPAEEASCPPIVISVSPEDYSMLFDCSILSACGSFTRRPSDVDSIHSRYFPAMEPIGATGSGEKVNNGTDTRQRKESLSERTSLKIPNAESEETVESLTEDPEISELPL